MATTTTGSELIANVLSNPKDANALLVLADWLGEQGWSDDEERCRTEAKELLDGKGPLLLSDYRGQSTRDNKASEWNQRTQWLLVLALKAAAPERVEATKKNEGWRGDGEYTVRLDGRIVELSVQMLHTGSWSSYLSGKATCTIRVDWQKKKVFPYGKSGFSTHKIVAEVFTQLQTAVTKDKQNEESNKRWHRLEKEIKGVKKEFAHSYEDRWSVDMAKYGERLTLSIERSPEEIREVLKVLKDAGLLKKEQD